MELTRYTGLLVPANEEGLVYCWAGRRVKAPPSLSTPEGWKVKTESAGHDAALFDALSLFSTRTIAKVNVLFVNLT
jgi:hypothetical protein